MEEVQYISLPTGKKVVLPPEAVSAEEVAFMRSAIRAGGAELGVPPLELVIERPHAPEDPGKVEEGALLYFLRRPGTQGVIAGAVICWAEDYSPTAWGFAHEMQENSDVVGLASSDEVPPVPWSAAFCTSDWETLSKTERKQVADLDIALAWACV